MQCNRRSRTARHLLPAALVAAVLGLAAPASAQVTTDMNDWNLTTSTVTHPSSFHISTGGSLVEYRWLDSPNVGTVVTAASCVDLSGFGSTTYGIGDTSYRGLYAGFSAQCFRLRGRTTSGSLTNHDGRVRR